MKTRIPIKKYTMDETIAWEERYHRLDAHHREETQFLITRIEELEKEIEGYLLPPAPSCGS